MTQTPERKYRASLAAQNALRIRFANNTPRLDLAIKAAEAEATVVRTVPLLFQQPLPQGSRVFSYEDQTYLLLRMEPDGSYYPMVPTTNADRSQAQMITDQRMRAGIEAQVFSYKESLTLEGLIENHFQETRMNLRKDPSKENHAALSRLVIDFIQVLSESSDNNTVT